MARRHIDAKQLAWYEADPCPFCHMVPSVQYWHGGGAKKRMVRCVNEACHVQPSVTGGSREVALKRWNDRRTKVAR